MHARSIEIATYASGDGAHGPDFQEVRTDGRPTRSVARKGLLGQLRLVSGFLAGGAQVKIPAVLPAEVAVRQAQTAFVRLIFSRQDELPLESCCIQRPVGWQPLATGGTNRSAHANPRHDSAHQLHRHTQPCRRIGLHAPIRMQSWQPMATKPERRWALPPCCASDEAIQFVTCGPNQQAPRHRRTARRGAARPYFLRTVEDGDGTLGSVDISTQKAFRGPLFPKLNGPAAPKVSPGLS